jgi:hypothetical protein
VNKILTISALFFFILQVTTVRSQQPDEMLNRLAAISPIEKVYLHLDRDNYVAGETAWFKAYLQSNYLPDTISTVLYVELMNKSSVVLSREILPVLLGVSNGQIEIPDSLPSGNYLITAYTTTMLNSSADFIYRKSVFIYGKKNEQPSANTGKSVKLDFFPEGGNAVNDFSQVVAFKAADSKGFPINISGEIRKEGGQKITGFSSFHDGMGIFDFTPHSGEKYYAVINGKEEETFYLPPAVENGISLSVIPHPQGSFFEIKQKKEKADFTAAYMIGQMQHQVVFKTVLVSGRDEMQGVIDTRKLNSGILQLTVFNRNNIPLAERLVFVDNYNYLQPAEITADTLNFSTKGKNRFTIRLKDTVQGNLSVSVTDAAYAAFTTRPENIVSDLLFTSDLRGYIHNPAWYFSADNDSVKTSRDLVMMTNGWRRFVWKELPGYLATLSEDKGPSFITLSGKVTLRDSKKPFDEKMLLLMIVNSDSSKSAQVVTTDKKGNFRLDSLIIYGKSRIFFSDVRGKKSLYIDVELTGDSINRAYSISEASPVYFNWEDLAAGSLHMMEIDYEALLKEKGKMLEAVTITVKKKTPLQILEEKYAKGAFEGGDSKTFDLVNSDDKITYNSIFDYLDAKGLRPGRRNMPTLSSLGAYPVDFYLDEILVDADVIETIPFYQVAMIKVYNTFAGGWGNSPGGAVAVYMKKGEDLWSSLPAHGRLLSYNGFSVIREFYAPDYTANPGEKNKTDNRITLDWRPSIFINNVSPKIPLSFYNSDRTKAFKIIIEGMTTSGKLICIEKIFSSFTNPGYNK